MYTINADDLNRFMRCQGSRLMAAFETAISTDTTARDEGTAAHHMATSVFVKGTAINELIDTKAPNGFYMSAEMAGFVEEYLTTLATRTEQIHIAQMEVDTSLSGENWKVPARADHIAVIGQTLHIDDFKYGWRIVEPEWNWTLIAHAIGYCRAVNCVPSRVVFTIHQPRPYHPDGKTRSWEISGEKLQELQSILFTALDNPSDQLVTSMEHCGKCPSIAYCPAAQKAAMNGIECAEMAFNDELSNDELSREIDLLSRAAKAVISRLDASRELAKHRIKSGQIVPNYEIEPSYSNRTWKNGINVALVKMLTGVDISETKTKTPAQAEKMGISKTVINAMTETKITGMNLTRATADTKAKRIFGEK